MLEDGTVAAYLDQLSQVFRDRITVMDDALREHLPFPRTA